jgi:hypothetical protein
MSIQIKLFHQKVSNVGKKIPLDSDREWWHMPVITALGGGEADRLRVSGQPRLQNETLSQKPQSTNQTNQTTITTITKPQSFGFSQGFGTRISNIPPFYQFLDFLSRYWCITEF